MIRTLAVASLLLMPGALNYANPAHAADYSGWTPLDTARWTGAYIGLAGSYNFGDMDVLSGGTTVLSFDQSGGVGWIYGGYNWQLGNIVAGLEADLGTGSVDGSDGAGAGFASSDLNYMGSLRGRVGYLIAPQFLVYGTAGFAWSDMDITLANSSASETFTGYTIGAGTELNFTGPWTLRLEYLYTDFGDEAVTRGSISRTIDPDQHSIRAGVSFKF